MTGIESLVNRLRFLVLMSSEFGHTDTRDRKGEDGMGGERGRGRWRCEREGRENAGPSDCMIARHSSSERSIV